MQNNSFEMAAISPNCTAGGRSTVSAHIGRVASGATEAHAASMEAFGNLMSLGMCWAWGKLKSRIYGPITQLGSKKVYQALRATLYDNHI